MTSLKTTRAMAVALLTLAPWAGAWATPPAAPAYLPIQGYLTGYLTDASGQPVNGQVDVTVSLWPGPTGGTALYQETQTVQVDQGSFSLYLGQNASPPLDLSIFRDRATIFVGVSVDGGPEVQPRYQLATTPYAGFAQFAGTVDWSGVTNVPSNLGQGGALGGLSCASGQVAKWNGSAGANLTLTGTTFVPPGTAYAFHVYMTDTQTNVPNDAFFGCQVDYSTTRLRP